MEELYVDRYLCPNNKTQNLDTFSFLMGEMTYISPEVVYTMDVYKQFKDIRNNPYNFIIGNGGLGKSTYLKQIKTTLEKENIPCLLIELKSLSDENSLYNRINQYLRKLNSKEIYLLLDAIDEAIDCNIQNVANKICDAISQIITSYKVQERFRVLHKDKLNNPQRKKQLKRHKRLVKILGLCKEIKTIITCRDNRVPNELVPNLKKIYNTKENNTFHLCRLTEDDAKNIAKNLNCKNTDDFINKVKEYNLGSFASSPITLRPLVVMYNNNELESNSNNYDIYEKLMSYWCEESEYRKNKAWNNEDNFQLKPTDEILFVASKIAIELKLTGKNELSYNYDNSTIPVETFYNMSFDLPCGKTIHFSTELVDYTLKTKIFCKVNNKFFIEQQTYKDFLVARYLYEMRASEKNLFKLLKVKKDFHPNFTESIAYLAVKNNKIFKLALKQIPERILLSSVFFCSDKQKETLLNAYLKCVKNDTISFWNYSPGRVFFNKKLYFREINKILKHKLNTKNKDIKEIIIDIIWDNRLHNFDFEFRNIIFDSSESTRIKTLAIYASYDCQYNNVIKELAENLDKFNEEIKNDEDDQLRGILLNCLYPDYIDTETMLGYIKEPKNDNFFGYYRDFIKYKFPKSVNENNAGLFLDWIRENRKIREIVKARYNEGFSIAIKEIFKQISEMLNFDLITKYISLQLTEKYAWNIVSNDIMNKILDNNKFRIFFINQLIKRSSSTQNFEMLIWHLPKNPITTYELPIYLKMYIDEKDEFRKTIIASLIRSTYREYLYNGLTDDIDGIYELIHSNKELLDRFGYFINTIDLNPLTLEPIDKYLISEKRHYYANLKNKEKEKTRQQEIKELNNIEQQLEKILDGYKQNKDILNTVLQLFKLLNLQKDSTYYEKRISIILEEHIRWKDVPENKKTEIIDIFKEFLLNGVENKYTNIDDSISENKFNRSWNCLGILPLLKDSDLESYNKILQDWADVIIYISADSEDALKLKQELINGLYTLKSELVYNGVTKVITKTSGLLSYNFLKSLELVWNKELDSLIFDNISSQNIKEEVKLELVQALAYHQYEPIENYIKTYIRNLLRAKEVDDNKIGNLLDILFYGFQGKTWKYIKDLIYNNKISKETFSIFIRKTASQNIYAQGSIYKLLNSKELVELYKWLIKKYPYINQSEYKTGIYNTDWLKDFTEHIPDYFITTGNVDAYKKIKKAYLINRKNKKNYKKFYNRNLKTTKYNNLQSIKINHDKLTKLENLYYKEKKGLINMKIGKYIFGDNSTNNINENCNNKNFNIGTGITITILISSIAMALFIFDKIDFSQLLQLLR